MQTVSSLAERLDMSAEEALEKLRHMFFEVEGVESDISDEQCDILIDVDDEPALADEVRNQKLAEKEKEEKAAEKRRAAAKKAAAKKAKAAAKKTAAKKKSSAKQKAPAKKKAAAKKMPLAAGPEDEAPAVEILPEEPVEAPVAEILPDLVPEEAAASEPKIVVGSAIDHEERHAEVIRADGTHVDVADLDGKDALLEALPEQEDEPGADLGPLAQAEKQQAEEDRHRVDEAARSIVAPDPHVVAEVIRKANEKKVDGRKKAKDRRREQEEETSSAAAGRVQQTRRPAGGRPPSAGSRKTGKTARKRQRKLERMRSEETMRRSAAAAIKEYQSGAMDGGPKKRRKKRDEEGVAGSTGPQVIHVGEDMSVEALAQLMDLDPTDIILELMEHNVMATKNQILGIELVRELAEPQGFEVQAVIAQEEDVMAEEPDEAADLQPRAPVITVMGHVDHGKTSLLDQVRKASVAEGEAGGITQHIAAYEVAMPHGSAVFLDTPGHEAFTAMRARGAQVTDVVVLVVAADDGIMPQTREAIDHAKAAGVPIVVAINKCDKADAEPDRIRQELTQFELVDEQWGGKTIMRNISALTGDGISELMELLVLETELLELKANPNKSARGTIIESEIARGQGPVAWVLVNSGTLRVGDIFLAGESYGRVRAMHDSAGVNVQEAGPSTPVVVLGFNSLPAAGDKFIVAQDERTARSIANQRAHQSKLKAGPAVKHITLEDFHKHLLAGETSELNVVVKADVQGSVDVLGSSLPDIGNEEVRVKIVHAGVGAINESDVLLASASDAVILGFHVEATVKAESLAQREAVSIRTYKVIYEMIEDVRKSLEGLLAPEEREVVTGHTEVRQIFKSSALGNIAGCMQIDGEIRRDSRARLQRDGEVIYDGKVDSLRREKDSVSSVQTGFECGITLENFDAYKEGDVIETYRIEEVAKTLA